MGVPEGAAQFSDWTHRGSMFILTTPEGGNLPEGAVVENFPLRVRLHREWFHFPQAHPEGDDLRFSMGGQPLAYQIDTWDAEAGSAEVWVKIPVIRGNARQEISVHWGKSGVASASEARSVFNAANGYAGVWHLGGTVEDATGGTMPVDEGTTPTPGMIGAGRRLAAGKGVLVGEAITTFPSGAGPMTTEAWFRAERANGTVLAWGEEKRPCKVMFNFLSPPRMAIQCYFADVEARTPLATGSWYHVVHTYAENDSRVYVNGVLEGNSTPLLDLPKSSRCWIGGWYGNYSFVGDVDEVRISSVVRSPDWIRLQHENQKPLQTVVGPVVAPGSEFARVQAVESVQEGASARFAVKATGAQKVYWVLKREGTELPVAVDQFAYELNSGRVTGDTAITVLCRAVYPGEVKEVEFPVVIREAIGDPEFTLEAPPAWDGRTAIEVRTRMDEPLTGRAEGASPLTTSWATSPFAVIKETGEGRLILKRSQNSGVLVVTATMSNGGASVTRRVSIAVTEPVTDPWISRQPVRDEAPEEGQFYARDDSNRGTLHWNGTLDAPADSVFLRLSADGVPVRTERATPAADRSYALSTSLKPGLVRYRVEFGSVSGGKETVHRTVGDIVCGDAFLISGQSNALATDTGEKSPPETHEWIRSYGRPSEGSPADQGNLWCRPVWKAEQGEKAELGWWGMELAKRLVASEQVPIFMINAAVGGTRIDQHQRDAADPGRLDTIYGRMLWRVRQARLTHGIRAILWHQGESDQGADGPTGGYGWETYHSFFEEMAAGWKQDFPNVNHYYVFQIWPDACSMGGRHGSGDRLRERQRTLPRLFSKMSLMSTLGIMPPGPCHFPLAGWSELAAQAHPLIERDFYGVKSDTPLTGPNLVRAEYTNAERTTLRLDFDQPVVWMDSLASQFHLDGESGMVAGGRADGRGLTLDLKQPSKATTLTYLKEAGWSQDTLLRGANGRAALTFCEVPLGAAPAGR